MSNNQRNQGRSISIDELFGLLAMDVRRRTVKYLLAGNDTQCFTTQQYLDTYIREIDKGMPSIMDLELARKHLVSLAGDGVKEVRPDVWTR